MRCSHCGQALEDAVQPFEPGQHLCPRCIALHEEAARRVAVQDKDDQRYGWVAGFVFGGAVVGSFLLTGFLGFSLPAVVCYALAGACGVGAGIALGRSWGQRVVYMPLGVVACVGALVATSWYTEDRSSIYSLELLLPVGLGALPGFVLMLVAALVMKRRAAE